MHCSAPWRISRMARRWAWFRMSQSNYAAKISKQEALIDWSKPASVIDRQIRAFNPFPAAYTLLGDLRIKVWQAEPVDEAGQVPGQIVRADNSGILVSCGQQSLLLTQIQLPGKSRMPVSEILRSRAELFTPSNPAGLLMNTRAAVAEVLAQVLRGKSLSALLPEYSPKVAEKDVGLFKELCFGTLRWYPAIELLLKELMQKPLREKDFEIQGLLASGLYQLIHTRIADHAAINETVVAVAKLQRPWAKGLVNAVLRNFLRQRDKLDKKLSKNPVYSRAHPQWLLDHLFNGWGSAIALPTIEANNQRAPMTLRVNQQQISRDHYLEQLSAAGIGAEATAHSEQGIVLASPVDISALPGFAQGQASVQDEAAQLAASLLLMEEGQRVLDACCARGARLAIFLKPSLTWMG